MSLTYDVEKSFKVMTSLGYSGIDIKVKVKPVRDFM